MSTATANLENDHVHILKLIDVMEQLTQLPEVNIEHLDTIVNLIRSFADGTHHTKEEKLLFPKLAEKGFSLQQGPVAVMLHDHEEGRGYVRGMADNISLYKSGNEEVLSAIYKNMKGYIELLRAHIDKENNVLFRMADQALSAEEQQSLLSEFKKVESNPACGGVVADCIRIIEDLAKTYHIS